MAGAMSQVDKMVVERPVNLYNAASCLRSIVVGCAHTSPHTIISWEDFFCGGNVTGGSHEGSEATSAAGTVRGQGVSQMKIRAQQDSI